MDVQTSKLKGIIWLCLGIFSAGAFAFGFSSLIALIPWSYEKKLASKLDSTAGLEICTGAEGRASLDKLVKVIYPLSNEDHQFDVEVNVSHSAVVNAFAELGGQIYIFSGLLDQSDTPEEIAGILAHEISHVARRHILQAVISKLITTFSFQVIAGGDPSSTTQILNMLLGMRFTREEESEADSDALLRLKKASVSGKAYGEFFKKLKGLSQVPDFLSDHPASDSRASKAQSLVVDNPIQILSPKEWLALKNICGER